MDKRIVYPLQGGGIAVLHPVDGFALDQIARRDVPANTPYRLVAQAELPDPFFSNACSLDFSTPDGYGDVDKESEL